MRKGKRVLLQTCEGSSNRQLTGRPLNRGSIFSFGGRSSKRRNLELRTLVKRSNKAFLGGGGFREGLDLKTLVSRRGKRVSGEFPFKGPSTTVSSQQKTRRNLGGETNPDGSSSERRAKGTKRGKRKGTNNNGEEGG